jgi:hypothetical protein
MVRAVALTACQEFNDTSMGGPGEGMWADRTPFVIERTRPAERRTC